jgi:hypothetical protein
MARFTGWKRAGLGVACLAAVLTGCSFPSNSPEAYDDTTQANFVQGCTGVVEQEGTTTVVGSGASNDYCTCAYDWFSSTYPYSADTAEPGYSGITFTSLGDSLSSNPEDMPAEVQQGMNQACGTPAGPTLDPTTTTSQPQ